MTLLAILLALALPTPALAAHPLVGQWQGILPQAPGAPLKTVLRIEERTPGRLACFVNAIERGPEARRCTAALDGAEVRITFAGSTDQYQGRLRTDGLAIEGRWTASSRTDPLILARTTPQTAWATDQASHTTRMVKVAEDVWIEVLDYGGSGPPVILIPGLGLTGHTYDTFAPRLTAHHRVYAISPRGYGLSDMPPLYREAYNARRQGDDVLAVMEALGVERAALAGWSLGGEHVSSVASRHPEKVSAAIYLDGAYAYAFYAPGTTMPAGTNLSILANDLQARLREVALGPQGAPAIARIEAIRRELLPALDAELAAAQAARTTALARSGTPAPAPSVAAASSPLALPPPTIGQVISSGVERFDALKVPVLAIFATESPAAPSTRAHIDRYRAGNPSARILEIPGGEHDIFSSHPDETLEAMESLMGVPARSAAPGGEAVVRKLVQDFRRGEPDYAQMTPALAAATRTELAAQRYTLNFLGEVRSITLVNAAPDGRDRYRVEGETGAVDVSVAQTPAGVLQTFVLQIVRRPAFPGGETVIRKVIEDVKRGEPDYARMAPAMAARIRRDLAGAQALFNSLGEVRSVTFVDAEPNGFDEYQVQGANGTMETDIILTPDGLLQSIGVGRVIPTP